MGCYCNLIMNKTIHIALIISLLLFVSNAIAQERSLPGTGACFAHCTRTNSAPVRATDWVSAWQAAKEGCPEANTLALQIADRSGPEIRGVKIFECVDLKASGELLVIRIKKGDRQDDTVMILRAADLIRIEVSRRPAGQD